MTPDELTLVASAHQSAISRHDQEMAEIRAILRQSADRHADHEQWQTEHEERLREHERWQTEHEETRREHDESLRRINETLEATARQQEANARQIALSRQDINTLTASIQELRNMVADYMESRANTPD